MTKLGLAHFTSLAHYNRTTRTLTKLPVALARFEVVKARPLTHFSVVKTRPLAH